MPAAEFNPPMGPWTYVVVQDPRWSQDGRYFSFTMKNEGESWVIVLDTSTWREVTRIPDAVNGFVLSAAVNSP